MADGPGNRINRRRFLEGAAATGAAAAGGAGVLVAAGCASTSSPPKASSSTEKRVDVVIVGGGMAGLYAARVLGRKRSFVLLEANGRLGGRVLNLKTGSGPYDVTEAGGEWISPKQPRVNALVREFGLRTFKNYDAGAGTLVLDGAVTRLPSSLGAITALSKSALANLGPLAELAVAAAELEAMAAAIPVDAPWNATKAAEWDSRTAASWIESATSNPLVRYVLGFLMGGPVSVLPGDISLLHYLFIAAASGGPSDLTTPGRGVLTNRIVGGTGRFVEGLGRPVRGVTQLSSPVTAIEQGRDSVRVTTPGGTYVAGHVIVAMAPTMTQQILFDPVLPVDRSQSVQRIGMGSAIKCFPIYASAFWRQKGLSGEVLSNSSVFGVAFDNSPPSGTPGVLFALAENTSARRLSAMSPEARKSAVLDDLAVAFGEEARHPIGYVEHDWSAEPWIRGGAAAFFPPGVLSEYRYLFDQPIGRLHFAGTETGQQWWGNMEAALATGERAAHEVLSA